MRACSMLQQFFISFDDVGNLTLCSSFGVGLRDSSSDDVDTLPSDSRVITRG